MKLARFLGRDGTPQYGIIEGDTLYEASGASLVDLHPGDPIGAWTQVRLLAPITPGKIVCVGMNYLRHVIEREPWREMPTEPSLFLKPPSAVIGPGDFIELPFTDHPTHHEAELVAIIGRTARRISPDVALDHVAGFTCGNDVTDEALHDVYGQGMRAKSFETFCPLGPWIETELDVTDLHICSRVNGESKQAGSTEEMAFDVPAIIAFVSSIMTLYPGDAIMTGTPAGISHIHAGDLVEVEVEGIGVLSNPVRLLSD